MARLGRYFLPDQPLHVIQRGNDRQAVFHSDEDRQAYLGWLLAGACDSLPRMMQSLGRRYVRYANTVHRRTGTLWQGRYRAAPIDSEAYPLACCRYVEFNPVRAGMVRHPHEHRWSSYPANALGAADALVTPHPLCRTLGRSAAERQASYRALFRERLAQTFGDRPASRRDQQRLGIGRRCLQAPHRQGRQAPRRCQEAAHPPSLPTSGS